MQNHEIYLVQTDTTIGFLSPSSQRLSEQKGRPEGKPFLREVSSLLSLKQYLHLPKSHKNRVRRSQKVTFVDPFGISCRRVNDKDHTPFVERFGVMYSTSANESGKSYDEAYAKRVADVLVCDKRGLFEAKPSRILRLGKKRVKKIR